MTEKIQINWQPPVTNDNTFICSDCGAFVWVERWDQHVQNLHVVEEHAGRHEEAPTKAPAANKKES